MRYSRMRQKEVVNLLDGCSLGYISDLEIDELTGKVCSILVPGKQNGFLAAFSCRNIVIPWGNIVKFGGDIILVEVDTSLCETVK